MLIPHHICTETKAESNADSGERRRGGLGEREENEERMKNEFNSEETKIEYSCWYPLGLVIMDTVDAGY